MHGSFEEVCLSMAAWKGAVLSIFPVVFSRISLRGPSIGRSPGASGNRGLAQSAAADQAAQNEQEPYEKGVIRA